MYRYFESLIRSFNGMVRIWPFLICLFVSMLILGGYITQNTVEAENGVSRASLAFGMPAPKQQKIDTTKPWNVTFDSTESTLIDTTLWTVENGNTTADYNNELQTYTDDPSNVRIENNELVIEARAEQKNGKDYTSARINTKESFAFTYGTLEVTMKIPRGVGSWPAAWLLPADNKYKAADFPGVTGAPTEWALNGEIDFMEAVGYIEGEIIPASHSFNSLNRAVIYSPGYVTNPYDEYHTYGVIKTPTSITFTIDGVPYASRVKTSDNPLDWPYDQPYYLIMNVALGGKWAGDKGMDNSYSSWKMSVRSIDYKPL